MTAELAASIIDWRDEDSEISPGGAEDEYYLLLSEPYNCKNSELETVDEILLIKGASEELLYGEDTNLNGILDDNENDGDLSDPDDNRNGRLDTGFYDYVTVYSVEENVDSEGGELETLITDMTRMAATLERAGTSLDTLATNVNESGLIGRLQSIAEDLGPAGQDLSDLAARLDRFVKGNEHQIADAIRSIRDAALELETMLEDLKANPSRILADPPPKGTPGGGS